MLISNIQRYEMRIIIFVKEKKIVRQFSLEFENFNFPQLISSPCNMIVILNEESSLDEWPFSFLHTEQIILR